MGNDSALAENVILEIGSVDGTEEITNMVQVGTETIVTFNKDCESPGVSDNYAFPPKLHEGDSYNPDIIFVGNPAEGCSQQQVSTPGMDFIPVQKCMVMQMFWQSGGMTPQMLNQLGTGAYNNFESNGWSGPNPFTVGNNHSDYPRVVDGRCLYMKNTNTGKTLCFDIVTCIDKDTLLLKGLGTDNVNALNYLDPDLAAGNQCFKWYISAYQHSGEWDESHGDFRWDSEGKGTTLSYEGHHWNPINNRGFNQGDSFFGLRNSWLSNSVDYAMFYEIELNVTSVVNAKIMILSGTHPDPIYNTMTYQHITTPGVYKFCVPRLALAGKWSLDAPHTYDGSVETIYGVPACVFEGSVGLLRVNKIHEKGVASCIIDSIKVRFTDADTTTTYEPIMGVGAMYTIDAYKWNYLDVLESRGVPLSLNFSVGDLRDIGKRTTGYSKTFNIPASQHNNEVLTPMMSVGSERKQIFWQKARIKVDGVYVFKGLMRIEEGNTGSGGFYKCHIIQDDIDWSQAIGANKLCELALGENPPVKKGYTSIKNSWDNSPDAGDDYFYGLVNYGEWYSQSVNPTPSNIDYDKTSNDFHPVIFTKAVVDKIFNSIGYSIHSNFFNSTTFKKLCHPYSSGEDYAESDLFGSGGSQFVHAENYTKYAPSNMDPIPYPCMTCAGVVKYHYPNISLGSDPGNNWSGNSSSSGYTVPFTGMYHISWNATMFVKIGYSLASMRTRIFKNGVNISALNDSTAAWGDAVNSTESGAADGLTREGSGDVYLNAGDLINMRCRGKNFTWLWNAWMDIDDIDFNIYPIPSSTVPDYEVNLSKVLPCVKQMDYIKGLTEMFNLQWTADEETKTVYCEPYDDFFGSGKVLDWTDKLDYKSWNDKFIIEQLAKEITFEYKQDTGDEIVGTVYRWREAQGHPIYKSWIEHNDEKFRKETLSMGTKKFSSTIQFNAYGKQPSPNQHGNGDWAWGDLSWGDPQTDSELPVMPIMWSDTGGSINGKNRPPYKKTPSFDLRILNYYGKQDCSNWRFVDQNGTAHTKTHYPHLGWKNCWLKGVAEDPYSLHWGDESDGYGNTSEGLFTKYWRTAYEKMNGGAALRTCRMNLNAIDIAAFDYRDLIHLQIDGVSTYWTINKIIDYKPNQNELTKVELIEWKQAADYARSRGEAKRVGGTQDVSEETIIKDTKSSGLVLTNNTNNSSTGTGIAFGRGVVAEDNQTILGNYNQTNADDILQIGSGINSKNRTTALSVTKTGEVQIHGGELAVEETDGIVHDLVFTDENGDIKKVYLKKE